MAKLTKNVHIHNNMCFFFISYYDTYNSDEKKEQKPDSNK